MIKEYKLFKLLILLCIIFNTNIQLANEILIYADSINYDSEQNLIAKGNAKIIYNNEIIISDLIIYNEKNKKYTLPINFSYKDELNNFYYGSSGEFSGNFKSAIIKDVKVLLIDGSRIVGKEAIKNENIDLISKGSYSSCTSRISIKNFVCPIWQLDGEKILHDTDTMFLYQKHSKMRIFNVPIFYLPYLVTPSPLRKKRKSGFLSASTSFNFLNPGKVTQSTALPYYFNISVDKELTFTPIIKYGGGTDSSQKLLFDYNQIVSGGDLSLDLSLDTSIENENNESWLKNGSIVTNYNANLNEKFKLNVNSALQTSQTYLKTSDPNNDLSYNTSLSSTLNLSGYNLKKFNDALEFNISSYQVVQDNEDNKTTPTVFPYVNYTTGKDNFKNVEYENSFTFYNIARDKGTTDHAQKQKKLSHIFYLDNEMYYFKSKINFKSQLHNQFYETENKMINNKNENTNYFRIFPMTGLSIETPLKDSNLNLFITPKIFFILNSAQSNTNRISNEDSTNNNFNIENQNILSRYSGTDKLDNSHRLNYGVNIRKDKIFLNFNQNYEFLKNSNYHSEMGNNDYLSDALADLTYDGIDNNLNYELRYDPDQNQLNSQKLEITNSLNIGTLKTTYLDEKSETNSILTDGNEVISIVYNSVPIEKYSKINFNSSYNLITDRANEYSLGYSYYDECFGINLDFKRTLYADRELKPSDIITIMFAFKNLGSYQSSNLAVSENDKQDIEWVTESIGDEAFN